MTSTGKTSPTGVQRAGIHPTAVIEGQVVIGKGTTVAAHCVLIGPLWIGSGCEISAGCIIGSAPEHRRLNAAGKVVIGDQTFIRENCVIHRGTGQRDTTIGSNCYIMNRVYVGHDGMIANGVTLSAGVSLGGHVTILEEANVGMNAAVHQFVTIGGYSMVGMSTPVTRDIPPFSVAAGSPARLLRVNTHATQRLQLTDTDVWQSPNGLDYSRHPLVDEALRRFHEFSTRECMFETTPRSISGKPR